MMSKITIAIGVMLIGLGAAFYLTSEADKRSVTALIPAFVGLPVAILGLVALKGGESARKHCAQQVKHCSGNNKTINPVHHATVTGNDLAGVLHTENSLHPGFTDIPKLRSNRKKQRDYRDHPSTRRSSHRAHTNTGGHSSSGTAKRT